MHSERKSFDIRMTHTPGYSWGAVFLKQATSFQFTDDHLTMIPQSSEVFSDPLKVPCLSLSPSRDRWLQTSPWRCFSRSTQLKKQPLPGKARSGGVSLFPCQRGKKEATVAKRPQRTRERGQGSHLIHHFPSPPPILLTTLLWITFRVTLWTLLFSRLWRRDWRTHQM